MFYLTACFPGGILSVAICPRGVLSGGIFSVHFIGHSIFTGLRPYEDQKIENNVKLRRQYARRLRAVQSHPKRIRIVIPMVVVKVIVVVVD